MATCLAGHRFFSRRRPECHGGRRLVSVVSSAPRRGCSAHPGKCNQHGCPLARPVHFDRCVLARPEGQSAAGTPRLFRRPARRRNGSHHPAAYRPSHVYGVGALAVVARLRALCRQRPGLQLAAAAGVSRTPASAPASSRCGLGLWWSAFTSGISAPARAFC